MVCPASGRWVIVTAWNPGGVRADPASNETAHRELLAELQPSSCPFDLVMNGEGDWQEPAFLVRGATLQEALRWARTFGQAAVLFGVGGRAALVWPGGQVERYWAVRA